MKKKIAKNLRKEAEKETIGKHPIITRKLYRKKKNEFKENE